MVSSDVSHRKHFAFPLSPPSSGTVTAVSSPRLHSIPTHQPDVINQHFTIHSTRQNANIIIPYKRLQKPPVIPDVLVPGEPDNHASSLLSSHELRHKSPARSLNLPPDSSPLSVLTSVLPPATFSRMESTSSSSTSSSSIIHMRENSHTQSTGMGRKVAAKLQLFKETVGPTEDSISTESSRPQSSGSRRGGSTKIGDNEEIAEAQFKFVKRSEWPDREAAAIRRERSMTTLDRVKNDDLGAWAEEQQRDHNQYREGVLQEYNRWRRGFVERFEAKRGRRRDRTAAAVETTGEGHVHSKASRGESNLPRPSPHAFPPSPSPSRSPRRLSVSSQQNQSDSSGTRSHRSSWSQPFSVELPRSEGHSIARSASASAPISPVDSPSAWSTDDDSNWETASITTSNSTTPSTSTRRGRRMRSPVLLHNTSQDTESHSPHNSFVFRESDSDHFLHFDLSQEHLPHIPLRPFRNQVGGHSSIYKFTKQAVCKVRIPSVLSLLTGLIKSPLILFYPGSAPRVPGELVL